MEENKIELIETKPDDFRKGILSGEICPHGVKVIIQFKNGKILERNISWEEIKDFYEYHNLCFVKECYEIMVECNLYSE